MLLVGLTAIAFARPSLSQEFDPDPPVGRVTGIVMDEASNDPIPHATIGLWHAADSILVSGAITELDGSFSIDRLPAGAYYVRVSFVGYAARTISGVRLHADSMHAELGVIGLAPEAIQFEEVEVVAERRFLEIGIDRTVYRTEDQLVSSGGSASDVLANIPSVEIDLDGNISLRGSQGVAVLINGRPSLMTGTALTSYLEGLPSEIIERVEVIPNPSAKYEPDGMAGILNLVLRQDRDPGFAGGLTLGVATPARYTASGHVSYQAGRLGLLGSYGFSDRSRQGKDLRLREDRTISPVRLLDQRSDENDSGTSHNMNLAADFELGPRSSVSLGSMISLRTGGDTGLAAYRELVAPNEILGRYDRETNEDGEDVSVEQRIAFDHVIDPGAHELSIELEYEYEKEREAGTYSQFDYELPDMSTRLLADREGDIQDERNREGALQIDYVRPLGSDIELELGLKSEMELLRHDFRAQSLDADAGVLVTEPGLNNAFQYDQYSQAGYGIASTEVGRFGIQAGVRLEQAFTDFTLQNTGETFGNNYFSVFPSAFVVYELTEFGSARLSYSKRINRPDEWQLNPFDSNEEPLFKRLGNPFLKPEYIHSFEANFTQFTEALSLSVTPYFRRTVNEIGRFETLREDGATVLTFANFNTSDSWGTEVIGTFEGARGLRGYVSVNAFQVVTDGSNVDSDLSNNAFGFSTRANATFPVSPSTHIQVSYYYRAPMNVENGRMYARQNLDLALRQRLMGDRAHLSVRVRDLFNTLDFRVVRENALYLQDVTRLPQSQSLGISFTYNFGSGGRGRDDDGNEVGGNENLGEIEMR